MSFVDTIIERDGGATRLISAVENGKPAWFLLKLEKMDYPKYKKALSHGQVNISDLGRIIDSGWGQVPYRIHRKYD